MTKKQFEREKRYQAALAVADSLLTLGLLDPLDFQEVQRFFIEKYQPVMADFLR